MPKQSGKGKIGRWGDSFDGKGKLNKLDTVKTVKPSKFWNDPPTVPEFEATNEVCTNPDIKIDMNNQIFGGMGRQFGEVITYEASQFFNYKVAWTRFEKAKILTPSYVKQISANKYILGYCTTSSPSKFWEVEVNFGNGTFINLSNPILTILCPRPFNVTEFSQVDTDADSLVWEQLQGRVTIISPASGDGSLDPVISIIGNRTPQDPPILIKVSLPDDANIFDVLAIDTTLTERFKSIFCQSNVIKNNPLYQIDITNLRPFKNNPNGTEQNYIIDLSNATWSIPVSLSSDFLATIWEFNTSGTWQQFDYIPVQDPRSVNLSLFTHYRAISIYGKSGVEKCRTYSNTLYLLDFSPRGVVIDETLINDIHCISDLKSEFTVTPFGVKIINETEIFNDIHCISKLKSEFTVTPFGVKIINETETFNDIHCISKLKSTFQTDPLGGIIIG